MCNYSEYLKQKAKEEQVIKDMLKMLARLETRHFSDGQIMDILEIDIE